MQINLSKTPQFNAPKAMNFGQLSGGLNLRDLGYLVDGDESPCMKNLVWRDGLLQSRDGQRKVAEVSDHGDATAFRISYAACEAPFHGYTFFHVGSTLQCIKTGDSLSEPAQGEPVRRCAVARSGVIPGRGVFFQYMGKLYYKNSGGFYVIEYSPSEDEDEGEEQQAQIVRARFEVYRQNRARGVQTFSVFKLDGSTYRRISSLREIEVSTEPSGSYVIMENSSGRFLAYGGLPMDGEDSYSKSYLADPTAISIPAANVMGSAKFNILRPRANSGKVQLFRTRGDGDTYVLGVRPGEHRVAEGAATNDVVNDTHFKWLLKTSGMPEGAPAGSFRVVNLGLTREEGSDCATYYLPEAQEDAVPFVIRNVAEVADEVDNAPVILINADPSVRGSGKMYQPENCMSYNKTVWYNAVANKTFYRLPVWGLDAVLKVVVNGTEMPATSGSGSSAVTNWTADLANGTVTFTSAPIPADGNEVRITYRKANHAAKWAILDCPYATVVSGGDAAQFVVLGGCPQQPDAVFWNANDELAVEPWYFPVPCYNLIGSAGDPVTGFGKQYNDTLVFSDHSIGKLTYDTQTIDGRLYPAFGYARVNAKIGCDLPWTIQQVENNVVFCNSYGGAYIVLSSSAAYENNVRELSQKINYAWSSDGSAADENDSGVRNVDADTDTRGVGDTVLEGSEPRPIRPIKGLIQDIHDCVVDVHSFDDGERYWICIPGKVYVWDYSISTYADPSWFYWTDIAASGVFRDQRRNVYHLDRYGDIQAFKRVNDDNGQYIYKIYQFPTLNFGTYERLKDVTDLIITVRSDVPSTVKVRYDTDYESRFDRTNIVVTPGEGLTVSGRRLVQAFKRRPKCRHVRQFGLTLSGSRVGEDLALVSLQVFYRFTGKER